MDFIHAVELKKIRKTWANRDFAFYKSNWMGDMSLTGGWNFD